MGQKELQGLNNEQVLESRRLHGANVLTPREKESVWMQFLGKFRDPLIIILAVAGLLSVGISCYEYYGLGQDSYVFFEPVGIFIAILLATGLSFYFESKAEKEFEVLNRVNDDEPVDVLRNGTVTTVPRRDIVVGDIVYLNTGDEIPADGTLLEAVSLAVDESMLTGEPLCGKTIVEADFDSEATFPSNAVLRGTKVMEGHGVMKVDAVGDNTENGRVFRDVRLTDGVKTPLDEQFDRLGLMIARISYICAALVVVGRVLMYFVNTSGFEWVSFATYMLQTVMIVVALIVVTVPEGLPMAVTLSLAYSMRRMLRTNNLVRKMHACETMGATTVICTDKTGTLTQNRMQVSEAEFFDTPGEIVDLGIAVNSTAQLDLTDAKEPRAVGNPTEGALLLWLNGRGIDYRTLRGEFVSEAELPFLTERKFMAVSGHVKGDPKRYLFVKGAPEIIMAMCTHWPQGVTREALGKRLLDWQSRGMRTLGFAYAEISEGEPCPITGNKLTAGDLTLAGITAISDPVRGDVPSAIGEVQHAGVKIKIVTGDTPATAREIGRQVGLWKDGEDGDDAITTGPEIAAMSDDELTERVSGLKIIARARPTDKRRLVEALQRNGEVVAVTGDGTNDAPALKTAQVGLSMGDGTAVAKEASDITIIDNSFASIVRAVMWGRSLYLNIQRFIMFQMSVSIVATLVVLIGAFIGMQSPLTVTQMLWVNLIMDTFAAMALASLPPSRSVMDCAPRSRTEFIITPAMWRNIVGVGLAFTAILVWLMLYLEEHAITSVADIFSAPLIPGKKTLSTYELTVFFTVFVFLNFWNIFNARAYHTGATAFRLRGCESFVLVAVMIIVGQVLIVQVGGSFFSVCPLPLSDWLLILCATSPVLLIPELIRRLHR